MIAPPETEIFDTGCVNTFFNESPQGWTWLDASDSQRAIIEIDDTMFSTADGDPWAYKLRIVIYPSCDGTGAPSSSSFFSLSMSCIGCTCDGCECGAGGCASLESVLGSWTGSGRGSPSGCGAGGGGSAPPAFRSASTCPDLIAASECSYALTISENPPGPDADVAPDGGGERRAYASSCCYGRSISCSVPFHPDFANAYDQGCASWELLGTCTQNDSTTYMWKPVITSCDYDLFGGCGGSVASSCPKSCESCCSLCFAVGTRILLANGQTMAVEELAGGDLVASISFGGQVPNPTFTDLLEGWSATQASMTIGASRVSSVTLGYEQGRTTVGKIITVSPEHPILTMRKDGDVSFVSAAMLTDNARLVAPDGTTKSAGSVSTTSQTTVTVFLELVGATCLVANGVVCHVGTKAGAPGVNSDSGFTVSAAELNSVNSEVVDAIIGAEAPSVFSASTPDGVLDSSVIDPADYNDTMKGLVAGSLLPDGCVEGCTCLPSCLSTCAEGLLLFSESFGSMPCCDANPVGSHVTRVSISVDNRWLMNSIDVLNGDQSQTLVICRPTSALCQSEPVVLSVTSSDGTVPAVVITSEMVPCGGIDALSMHEPGSSVSMAFAFDGVAFGALGSSEPAEGYEVIHTSVSCSPSVGVLVSELSRSADSCSLSVWSPSQALASRRSILSSGLDFMSGSSATIHGIGTWSMSVVGGDGCLAGFGFFPDDQSYQPWQVEIPIPKDAAGSEVSIGMNRWIPFGARDGESMILVAVPLDGVSEVTLFRLRRDGSSMSMQPAARSLPRPTGAGVVSASGLQGKFLVSVEGSASTFEYDSASGNVVEMAACGALNSAVSCSKSHDLNAVAYGEVERCPGCSGGQAPCNFGGIVLSTCGTICTGKQFVVPCELQS